MISFHQKKYYYKGYMIDKRKGYVIIDEHDKVVSSQPSLEIAKRWIDLQTKEELPNCRPPGQS